MRASRLIRRRSALRQSRRGPLSPYTDRVAARYIEHHYTRDYGAVSLKSIGRFGRWLERCGLKSDDINEPPQVKQGCYRPADRLLQFFTAL
jgi:hypothetical protein